MWTSCMCLWYKTVYTIFCWLVTACMGITIFHSLERWQNLSSCRGGGERKQRCTAADISLHTAEVCAVFDFVSKACEPKNIYPAPVPCIWLTVVVSSNINISWLFILTHTDVLERLRVAGRTMWEALLDIWCHLQLELYCSKNVLSKVVLSLRKLVKFISHFS